jgi:peptidoglycan/xylan/chitin deacetylase (PgdA/CDA1 family)
MNQRLKRAIERAAVVSGLPRLGNIFNKNRCIVLMYHNIVPSGVEPVGDLSLHLTQPDFAEHLDLFDRHFDVVPLIDLLDDHASPVERPRIAITFDDAYVGALTVGVQELVSRRMPATIFVPPGLLGRETWWDLVASRTSGEIPADERRDLLVALGGRGEAILASVPASFGTAPRSASLRIANSSELAAAAETSGISIGSHTWTHPNLAALDPSDLLAELTRPFDWLRDRFPSFVPIVSYPYGLSSDSVEAAASKAGYRAGLRADGGWLKREKLARPFALPRFNIPANLSLDGLWARLGIGVVR